jgi:hypothetical protein
MLSERGKEQARLRRLGLRVVPPGGEVNTGSAYLLFPDNGVYADADWSARLQKTSEIVQAARGTDKFLHLIAPCNFGRTAAFDGSFDYGRVNSAVQSVRRAEMFGTEEAASIAAWVEREIEALTPAAPAPVAQPGLLTRFLNAVAHVFSCCNGYNRQHDVDLR